MGPAKEIEHGRLDVGQSLTGHGRAGDENELMIGLQVVFVQPVRLAHQAAGAIANDGPADLATRYHTERKRFVGRLRPVQYRQPALHASALVVDPPKLRIVLEALAFRECFRSMQLKLRAVCVPCAGGAVRWPGRF